MYVKKSRGKEKTPATDNLTSFFTRKVSNYFRMLDNALINCRIFMIDGQQIFPVKTQDYRMHIHNEYEIIIPEKIYHCSLNHTELTVHAGELLLLQPGDYHQDHLDPEEPYNSFRFACQFTDLQPAHNILKEITPEQRIVDIKDDPSIPKTCDLIWDEINDFSGGRFLIANGIFQGLFWKIISHFDQKLINENLFNQAKENSDIQKFLKVINRHLHDFPDIDKLCKEIGMSRSTLSRFSIEHFKLPPLRMLMNYKMQYAKECLESIPQITVKELSDKLGFANQFHFSTVYKRFFKTSPSKHIKKMGNVPNFVKSACEI